ncbi:MAG TPA: HEAT repeat domain-containing protein, partial [Kofleriaceae bacterium]|nr:HEAT repeat domain-containing protein [Kofleriaceae bacterium]
MNGGWLERLEAIAAGREVVAVAGWRDAPGVTGSRVHVLPVALLDGKAAGWSLDAGAAVRALGFAGDELLVTGGDDGRVIAWDLTGQRALATIELGAPVRALAIDGAAQRSEPGAIAVGTADGALHVIGFAIAGGTPRLAAGARRPLSDGAIAAVAFDPAGLVVAGAADGQLWIAPPGELAAARAVSPGGDGGIRAIACLGDGRAAIGCGDGSIRLCFVVGDVEAIDRSGDHGHAGAVRGLALGPVIVDDAGREQPRRLVSVGDDGAIKSWLIDGARRPRTLEPGAGPLAAIAYQHGAVAKTTAIGRLWIASAARVVVALPLGPDAELGEPQKLGSALDQIEAELRDPRAAVKVKLDAVERLAGIAEDEARVLLDLALATAPPEVQIAATRAMVRSERRQSRPAVRAALSAAQPELRAAAFSALLELERDQPLAALRPALKVASEDVRARAVDALAPLAKTSVIAAGMIADALRDNHPAVRRRAFQALRQVSTDPIDAIRTALARGTPDVRAEALLHLGFVVRAADPPARALAASALDDADPGVRTSAFLAAVMQRPRLAARLDAVVPSLKQAFAQVAGQLGTPLALPPDPGVTLDDDELEPVFAALACRAGDAAIRGAGCLLALGDPRALGAVLQLTREADPALRRGATANLIGAIARWPDDDRLSA